MTNRLLLLLIVLSISTLGLFHSWIKEKPNQETIERISEHFQETKEWTDRYPADFKLTYLNGQGFQLSDHIGKEIIMLNFFATWCGPCRTEMPELVRYYEKHKQQNFIVIGIDAEENEGLVTNFVKELKISFPVGIDQGVIQQAYNVNAFPTTVLIGVDGRIQYYQSGAISNAEVAFDTLLDTNRELLSQNQTVTKEQYLTALKNRKEPHVDSKKKKEDPLQGRAKEIALKMDCVCGCVQKVLDCECNTASKIVKKLKTMPLDGKTNQEVIMALNKEFCVPAEQ